MVRVYGREEEPDVVHRLPLPFYKKIFWKYHTHDESQNNSVIQ